MRQGGRSVPVLSPSAPHSLRLRVEAQASLQHGRGPAWAPTAPLRPSPFPWEPGSKSSSPYPFPNAPLTHWPSPKDPDIVGGARGSETDKVSPGLWQTASPTWKATHKALPLVEREGGAV